MKTTYEVVEELNEKLTVENACFIFETNMWSEAISFNIFGENFESKIKLWNSETSQQIYIEETDDYEPLEDTINRELQIVIEHLKNVL